LKNLEYWVLIQLGLDVGLFILVIFFIWKIRSLGQVLHAFHADGGNHAVEMASLAQKVENLEQRLLDRLEQSLDWAPGCHHPGEHKDNPQARPAVTSAESEGGKSLRAQVEELASRGLSPDAIARRLGLQPAEVKVALDLSRILIK
jgi:hypothetical protein